MADASTKVTRATEIVHIGSGASMAAAALSGSGDVSTALSGTGNLNRYPRADVTLMITATASIAATSTGVYLYRRDINVDSTADEKIPDTSNKQHYVGSFQIPAAATASTTHYVKLTDIPLSNAGDCEFYIESGLGVNILAGWTLKVTPVADYGATS